MSIRDTIEHLRAKPEHVRRRVALTSSFGVTVLVFVGWATFLTTSGTLALDPVEDASPFRPTTANLAGAAAALGENLSVEGSLTVVEGSASSTLDQQDTGEATVIPF